MPGCSPPDRPSRVQLLAVLLTSNAALIDVFEDSRLDLTEAILKNGRADGFAQLTKVAFNPDRQQESFVDFLGRTVGLVDNRPGGQTFDGMVLLYSSDATGELVDVRDGIFASEFERHAYIEKRDNFLVRSFGRLVKNLLILMGTMQDKTRLEAAILPARNFHSRAFGEFLDLCQHDAGTSDFQNQVVPALTAVTRLRGPRRRTNHRTKYFQDDEGVCFQYAYERHSFFETGADHSAACSIRGLFRLGVSLEQQRHFNVMSGVDKTPISGTFDICHDDVITVVDRTHLNMFSNDFVK